VAVVYLIYLAVYVLIVAGLWKMFVKAGEEGWKAIIPIWNTLVILRMVGREWWWILLMLIPIVGFVIWIIVCVDVARSFGRGGGFAVGLILLPIIFFPILGFGADRYLGPKGMAAPATA
jgi:hypothetical protein